MNSCSSEAVVYDEHWSGCRSTKGSVRFAGLRVRGAVFEREGRPCPGGAVSGDVVSGGGGAGGSGIGGAAKAKGRRTVYRSI